MTNASRLSPYLGSSDENPDIADYRGYGVGIDFPSVMT